MAHTTTSLTISLIMIVLFSVAIIGFAIGFANDNNVVVSIEDDTDMDSFYSNIKDNASTFNTEAETTYSSIINTTIEPGSDVLRTPGSFSVTAGNVKGTFENILGLVYKNVFGGDGGGFGIFIYTFIGIIVFLFAMFLIKTWRGNP